jgi:signal transduction histidine kinase
MGVNGTGIAPDVKERMCNRFFTNQLEKAPASASPSVTTAIVKQHAGAIEVDTQLGEFTEISVILPRAAALLPVRS